MSGATIADTINVHQSLTWCAHLWKAVTQQHHKEIRLSWGHTCRPMAR